MIILLDPRRWLAEGLVKLLGDLPAVVCDDVGGVIAAAVPGRGDILVVCHVDGPAASLLATACAGIAPAVILSGPSSPPKAVVGLLGSIVVGPEGPQEQVAAAAQMLLAHHRAAAAEVRVSDLEREAARLRELHTAGIDLLARVSHDLKNPLAVIRGYLALMLEERYGRTRKEYEEGLGIVSRRAAQMELLVGQLSDLAQIERGSGTLLAEAVDIGEVVSEVKLLLVDELRERGAVLDVVLPVPLPSITADRGKLRHILRNLLSNAVRHGRRAGTVGVRVTIDTPWVRIEVTDNGPGVDAAHGGAAFQHFFDDPAATGADIGIGLGLTVVRQFVRLHQGRLQVTSSPGGSTFTILIPSGAAGEP
jgi:signal transduction histidine kinase